MRTALPGLKLAGLAAIGISIFVLYRCRKKYADFRETAFYILVLTLVSSAPLLNDFTQHGHSIVFDLQRIENIKANLLSGRFPARMNYLSDGNAGVPTPVMYPELFLYIPALLRVLGIPPVFSLKLFHILLNLSCAFIACYSVSRITKSENTGVIFSGIYTLCIYRLENIYLRHAIGEAQAMVFIPLVMLGIHEILHNDHRKWHISVIGLTGILQSHVISLFLVVCFLILFLLFSVKQLTGGGGGGRIAALIKAAITTIFLNAWFIIPFAAYYSLVDAPGGSDLQKTAVYLNQMFAAFVTNSGGDLWNRGRTNGEMPLSLGGVIGIGLIIFFYVVYINKSDSNNEETKGLVKTGKVSLLFGLAAAFAASIFFPWYNVRPLNVFFHIQFAWRFFIMAAPLLSLPAGIGFYLLFRKFGLQDRLAVFAVMCVTIAGSAYYLDSIMQTGTYIYGTAQFTESWENGDYKYKGSDRRYTLEYKNIITASSDAVGINAEEYGNGRYVISYKNAGGAKNAWIEIPVYNFPGYEAYLDGRPEQLSMMNGTNNFIRVTLPEGSSNGIIRVSYRGLKIFIVGNIVSVITLVFFLVRVFKGRLPLIGPVKKQQRAEKNE